jgi:hypothetical protein
MDRVGLGKLPFIIGRKYNTVQLILPTEANHNFKV